MRYVSTRGRAAPVGFLNAVLAGMAPDGGLYVPEQWPTLPCADLATAHYTDAAALVLGAFAGDDLTQDDAERLCEAAYAGPPGARRWHRAVTPLTQIDAGAWMLELFHGPSLSFKDVAMQLIAPLYALALEKRGRRLTVVCATSGDTGGAAVEALKGVDSVDVFVLWPRGRISEVQRRFMTAGGGDNVYAMAVEGDFDACQAIVKALFADRPFAERAALSGVNSLNWARIVAQSVYFAAAASALSAGGDADFVVPTGNFGDAFSGYAAKRLGAPIAKIGVATNANDMLARALNSGRYERAPQSAATLSPAMDIQVASNFERALYEACDRDGEMIGQLYGRFEREGGFEVPAHAMARLREVYAGAAVDDAQTLAMIAAMRADYIMCPHTAVGMCASSQFCFGSGATIHLATAHPAKFPDTVGRAIGERPKLPARCADLYEREEKFDALPADPEAVKSYIQARSRAYRSG